MNGRGVCRLAALLASALLTMSFSTTGRAANSGDEPLQQMQVGGLTRTYILHVPAGLARGKPVPLVVALHGGGGNARASVQQTGLNDVADREGFIVVHPNGTGKARPLLNAMGKGFFFSWNAGTCCGYAVDNHIDDVGFIRALVKDIERRYPIDPKRIYATGISNGAMMSYRLACEMSDTFAAVGIVAGAITLPDCTPSQPVSVIHFHGDADQNVPLLGGVGTKSYDKNPKPPVMNAINLWVRRDGAKPDPQVSQSGNIKKEVFAAGRDGTEVIFYLIHGGGHAWPGGPQMLAILDRPTQEISATPLIWQFFKAHPKP